MMSHSLLTCCRCRAALPESGPELGSLTGCPSCGAELTVLVFPAMTRVANSVPTAQAVLEESEAACFYHADKRAVIPCSACGRFLCSLCDVELHGSHFCPGCLEIGTRKGRLPSLERSRTRYDRIVWTLLIVPLPLCLLAAPFTALAAVVLVFWKWRAPPSIVVNTRLRLALGGVLALVELAVVSAFWVMAFLRS
jgi:hypothetical protein